MGIEVVWLAVLGLLVGSFLNVVIHRVPIMMEQRWAREYSEMRGEPLAAAEPFNLVVPRSRCPSCGHTVRWFENIPVLSFIVLRGRCSGCGTAIRWRYPVVEAACSALFAYCAWRWGLSAEALAWCGFSATLLTLGVIDWDTTLLPDDINLPFLWAGILVALLHWTPVSLPDSVWGAVGGYLSLWTVFWVFKLLTGKEGMGFGDFKLFAALGAWFGVQALIPLILLASIAGSIVGILMKLSSSLREGAYVPFGPFLALAGFGAMIFGAEWPMAWLGL